MCVFLWLILSIFLTVCLSVTVKWLAVKTTSEMTYTLSGVALNSAQSSPKLTNSYSGKGFRWGNRGIHVPGKCSKSRGGTEQDIEAKLGKARTVYRAVDKWWKSKVIGRATKVKMFSSNIKAILLYASWVMDHHTEKTDRLQVFLSINVCEGFLIYTG